MNERKRQRLVDKVRRPSGTIGEEIPDEITIQGATIDLNEFVFECERLDTVPESERERIDEMKTKLQRERLERKHRIARDEISCEEGERLVRSIYGIDRALNALDGLDSPGIEEELRQKKLEDARELLSLIR
ncbi:hypothetical protein SAMN05216559_3149 [Halomicrobium zhouii]|uniref:Uncharacterized protein n=1 Tax=Halomicrobium zhouii TaxID=767519 RepID=A0A1I6LUD7_9EURY|nr:DUF5788 family protein [Halomicrobium zhouii]SFS07073.1 hypothetical protein SAMN05216559_3149 [Halomicrobium zhouii]